MDKHDKIKLKVLIKSILVYENPNSLTANQLSDLINKYDWGFRTSITSKKISKLLSYELSRTECHFMDNIKKRPNGKYMEYYYQN